MNIVAIYAILRPVKEPGDSLQLTETQHAGSNAELTANSRASRRGINLRERTMQSRAGLETRHRSCDIALSGRRTGTSDGSYRHRD